MKRADRAWRQSAAAILVGVGLAVALGYGGIWPHASPGATSVQMEHTLLVWSGFPATETGRPVVLAGPRVLPPTSGFPTKADQTAFTNGGIEAPASYPVAKPTAGGYQLISPGDAIALLQNAGATGPTLHVTKITLGSGTFQTDRGPRRLPAWLVWFAGVRQPALVTATLIFNPAGVGSATPAIRSAAMTVDSRKLTITYATDPRPCDSYTLKVEESKTAVAIATVPSHGHLAVCSATRRVTVTLSKPLEGRVVVDGVTGEPVAVIESGQAADYAGIRSLLSSERGLHRVVRDALVADNRR